VRLARTIFFKRRRFNNSDPGRNYKMSRHEGSGNFSMVFNQNGGASSSSNPQKAREFNIVYNELYREVRHAFPLATLSTKLKCDIENLCSDIEDRRKLVSKVNKESGCSPLFIACKKGNIEIVEYLLSKCGADVEQKGLYEVQDDRSFHHVSPLWCASVAGKVKVVEVLVKYGADVNSVSDTGSTPVRSACFMTHLDIVRLLVSNKADIQKPNHNGGTCLINSVQSVELCKFLLENGADVNAEDIQNKTALHYAIQEHRTDTAKLLLEYKADPTILSKWGDDALQTSCLKGAGEIFNHLVDYIPYPPERVASAYELIGTTFLDEHHAQQKALQYWMAACDLRQSLGIEKPLNLTNTSKLQLYYRNTREFRTRSDLEAISHNVDELRLQSLLICERVLKQSHKDMIYRLMYRGAAYADSLQYQHCIDLWIRALELRVEKDTILFGDTFFTAQALVNLFLDLHAKNRAGLLSSQRVRVEDVISIIELLVSRLTESHNLLYVRPQFKRQVENYNTILKIITHLLHLLTRIMPSAREIQSDPYQPAPEIVNQQEIVDPNACTPTRLRGKRKNNEDDDVQRQEMDIRRRVHHIVRNINPHTYPNGDTLLHLACMQNNTFKSQPLNGEENGQNPRIFPSLSVVKLLVECGAKVNANNQTGSTPLHTASMVENFNQDIVEILLDNGAHIDIRNKEFDRPVDMLRRVPEGAGSKINPLHYITLKCLAARVVAKHEVPYKEEIPAILEEFIQAH